MLKSLPGLSIILTTYNRPDALRLVLLALADQTQLPDEVIVADDGSSEGTAKLITQLQTLPFTLKQVWQPDQGFRAAKIRNRAVLESRYDYLIFLDGDCIPFPDFISQHYQLMEKNWFVSGHRILLSKTFTQCVLEQSLAIHHYTSLQYLRHYFFRHTNRIFPLLRVTATRLRKTQARHWQGAKSCNLGIWKKDFLAINGFDENFNGWGYEDSDLVIRLIRSNILRKSGKYAIPVIHLWHPPSDRSQQDLNRKLLKQSEESDYTRAKLGIES